MVRLTRLCWIALAAIHVAPAAVLFRPGLAATAVDLAGLVPLALVTRNAWRAG